MKTRLFLSCLALSAVASAANISIIETSIADWANGRSYVTEPFNLAGLQPFTGVSPMPITDSSLLDSTGNPLYHNMGTSRTGLFPGTVWNDFVSFDVNVQDYAEQTFFYPIGSIPGMTVSVWGFAAYWDLTVGGGPAQGLRIDAALAGPGGLTQCVAGPDPGCLAPALGTELGLDQFAVGFWGFVSDTPLAGFFISGGNGPGSGQPFDMKDLSFGMAGAGAVPEPATLFIAGAGLLLVGAFYKRRAHSRTQ